MALLNTNIMAAEYICIHRMNFTDYFKMGQKKQKKPFKNIFFQLNEAYEEVDEQKRDVAGWKKKTQKANSEDITKDDDGDGGVGDDS